MAWSQIDSAFLQYQADASGNSASGYFIKAYAAGTSTPISISFDDQGSSLAAKVELDSLGYVQNGSGGSTLLYVDQKYRLVLYLNATDADNNTFANAVQDIDNIPQLASLSTAFFSKSFDTLNDAVINTNLVEGDALNIKERTTGNGGGGFWDVVLASSVTPNTYNIVQSTGIPSLALVLRINGVINVKQFGATGNGVTDDADAIMFASDTLESNQTLLFPSGNYLTLPSSSRDDIIYINGLANVTISGYGARIGTGSISLPGNPVNLIGIENSTRVVIQGPNLDIDINDVLGCTGERARLIYGYEPISAGTIIEDLTIRDCRLSIRNNAPQIDWGYDSVEGDQIPTPEGDTGGPPAHPNEFKLEGIHLVGEENNDWPHTNITVESCRFEEMTARAFWPAHCRDIFMSNCSMQNLGARRPQVRCIISNRDVNITNCVFSDENPNGDTTWIYMNRQAGFAAPGEVNVSNNTFYFGAGTCVWLDGSNNNAITGNSFRVGPDYDTSNFSSTKNYRSQRCIKLSQNSTTTGLTSNVSISGNACAGGDVTGDTRYPVNFVYGISDNTYAPVRNVAISGNSISGTGTAEGVSGAMVLTTIGLLTGFSVTGNAFHNNTRGISLANALKGVISGNNFSSSTDSDFAIDLPAAGALSDVHISGNHFNDILRGISASSGSWPATFRIFAKDASGSFTAAETITGGTSGVTATFSSESSYTFNQQEFDTEVIVTSPSSLFLPGETITGGTSGTTATVVYYAPGAAQFFITNNTFANVTLGIRNFNTSDAPIYDNVFSNCTTVLNAPANVSASTISNDQRIVTI